MCVCWLHFLVDIVETENVLNMTNIVFIVDMKSLMWILKRVDQVIMVIIDTKEKVRYEAEAKAAAEELKRLESENKTEVNPSLY